MRMIMVMRAKMATRAKLMTKAKMMRVKIVMKMKMVMRIMMLMSPSSSNQRQTEFYVYSQIQNLIATILKKSNLDIFRLQLV